MSAVVVLPVAGCFFLLRRKSCPVGFRPRQGSGVRILEGDTSSSCRPRWTDEFAFFQVLRRRPYPFREKFLPGFRSRTPRLRRPIGDGPGLPRHRRRHSVANSSGNPGQGRIVCAPRRFALQMSRRNRRKGKALRDLMQYSQRIDVVRRAGNTLQDLRARVAEFRDDHQWPGDCSPIGPGRLRST